jgi:aspartate kinase
VLISTGEQVTIALLAMALQDLGLKAKSYTGWQVPVLTDSTFTKARIEHRRRNMRADLDAASGHRRRLPGRRRAGNITTLGRGGSDTSAWPWRRR